MADLDPRIEAIRVQYGLASSDFWELPQKKGTWIAKHSALEAAAAKAGIKFDVPIIIEHSADLLLTSMVVQGVMGDRVEWATGETNETNYKVSGKQPAYPWAMSEKRAKDRVILKLIGLHDLTYSEDEADDFKEVVAAKVERMSAFRAKTVLNLEAMQKEINTAVSLVTLDNWAEFYRSCEPWMPSGWTTRLIELVDERKAELANRPASDPNVALDKQYTETMREDRPFPGVVK